MTRREVLSRNPRAGPEEYYRPAIRDEKALQNASAILRRILVPRPKPPFCENTCFILKAACAEYLGYYPAETPCKSETKALLREMARHCGKWETEISCMERHFCGAEKAIREIRRYAEENGILPVSR